MNMLIKPDMEKDSYVLLRLSGDTSKEKVRRLVSRGKYSEAMETAMVNGTILCLLREAEKNFISAGLILTKKSAHWDLTA